jgi:hypothetical protein
MAAAPAIKLYFQQQAVGEVRRESMDQPWVTGTITLTPLGEQLGEFFRFMTDEDSISTDPPFDPCLLDDDNWSLEVNGERRGITVPAIYEDGQIWWRWR